MSKPIKSDTKAAPAVGCTSKNLIGEASESCAQPFRPLCCANIKCNYETDCEYNKTFDANNSVEFHQAVNNGNILFSCAFHSLLAFICWLRKIKIIKSDYFNLFTNRMKKQMKICRHDEVIFTEVILGKASFGENAEVSRGDDKRLVGVRAVIC